MKKIITGVVLAVAGGSVQALEAGDTLLRLGSSTAIPHEHTSLTLGNGTPVAGDLALERAGAAVGSLSYMFTPNFALGFMITTPFKHQLIGHSGLTVLAGDFDVLYPTLTAQYHQEFDNFKPYVGIGATYAMFMGEDVNETVLPNESLGLDDKLVGAFELGLDYKLNETTYVNISAVYIDLQTDAQIRGGADLNIDMEINPVLWNFSFVHKL